MVTLPLGCRGLYYDGLNTAALALSKTHSWMDLPDTIAALCCTIAALCCRAWVSEQLARHYKALPAVGCGVFFVSLIACKSMSDHVGWSLASCMLLIAAQQILGLCALPSSLQYMHHQRSASCLLNMIVSTACGHKCDSTHPLKGWASSFPAIAKATGATVPHPSPMFCILVHACSTNT